MATAAKKWSGVQWDAIAAPAENPSDRLGRERYLAGLRLPAPSQWVSSHLSESQRLKGAVYLGVKCLAEQASMAELKAYTWHESARQGGDQDAKKPLPTDHPLLKLLRKPNVRHTLGMMLKQMVQQLSLTGTSLLWSVTDGFDTPRELWSVPTGTYQPIAPGGFYPQGGYRIMPFWPGPLAQVPGAMSAGGIAVAAEHMVAISHPHPLVEHEGLSPLAACDLALDTIDSIDRARDATMRRLVHPHATLETDVGNWNPGAGDLDRAREELRQLLYGPANAGGVAALPPGSKLVPYGDANVEIGWIESWSQLIGFVLSIFGVTKSLAFMEDESSFAQLYASIRQHNLFTMCPLLNMISDGLNLQLIWPAWGEDVWLELEPKKITDVEEDHKRVGLAGQLKLITNNEGRTVLGWPKVSADWGEERIDAAPAQGKGAEGEVPGLPASLGKPPTKKEEEQGESGDKETERLRPKNPQGRNSLGNRLILNGASRS